MNISAVIPLYNAEEHIIQTLNSLINQSLALDEIIIVDDCSTDRSLELVKGYSRAHSIVRIIELSHNQGVSAARNYGIMESRNDWIMMMDADDIVHSGLIQAQLERLGEYEMVNPKPVCVHPAYTQIDSNGDVLPGSEFYGQQLPFEETFGALLVRNYIISASGLLINRRVALKVGGYNVNLNLSEDYEFLLRLSSEGTFVYLAKPYVYYRRHLSNASANLEKMMVAGKAILERYTINEIKEAIFCRNNSEQKNLMDFVTLLFQYQQYDEGYLYLDNVFADELRASKLFYQALYFIEKNQENTAIGYLNKLVKLNDGHGAAFNNLGVLNAKMGNEERAKSLFDKALLLHPGYMDAAHNLAVLEKETQDYRFTKRELRENLLRYS